MTKKSNPELFSSLLYLVVGALLVIFRSQMLGIAMTIAGVIFIVSGVLDVLKKNFGSGAISLIIGIAILVLGWLVVEIVLLVLGILIAVKGAISLFEALKNGKINVFKLLFPILTIIIGILLAFGNALDIIILIAGVLLIVDGALGLIAALKK